MSIDKVPAGVAHKVPDDLLKALLSDESALEKWQNLTPLARNEWICWTVTLKQQKTRDEHVKRTIAELADGKRRPCCWMGCTHRTDKAINPTQRWILGKQTIKP